MGCCNGKEYLRAVLHRIHDMQITIEIVMMRNHLLILVQLKLPEITSIKVVMVMKNVMSMQIMMDID